MLKHLGPEPEWRIEDWLMVNWNGTHGNPVQQEDSGDEWWYNHTKIYENGIHVGYVACGYGTWDDAVVSSNSQNDCYSYSISYPHQGYVECSAFESKNDIRGDLFQTLARYDLDGNMVWCKSYNHNTFFKVIQDSDENLVAVGITKLVKDLSGNPIRYNPTTTHSGYAFDCLSSSNFYDYKANVIKTDLDGNKIWDYIYGNQSGAGSITSSQWGNEAAFAYSVIEFDGNYVVAGRTKDDMPSGAKGLLLEINKTGELLNKQVFLYQNQYNLEFQDIKEGNGNLAISGQVLKDDGIWSSAIHYFPNGAFTPNINNLHIINPSTSGTKPHSKSVFLEFIEQKNLFAIPVLYNHPLGGNGWTGSADCEIHFFADYFDPQTQVPNTIQAGHYKAFDLKMGIVEVNNGFATVSTKQLNGAPSYNANVQAILTDRYPSTTSGDCPDWFNNPTKRTDWMKFWDSDASVARYEIDQNLTVTKKWESTFDVKGPRSREYFPGDIKRQECLYGITADDDDEAIVISGNTSSNFDDNYLAKLYNDDCIGLTYDIHDNSDDIYDITSNTTWNSSKTVLGQLVVKSGNTLTISGSSTEIKFADSKRTGVKTNLLIEKNAKLIVDGATLTADDRCVGGYWEGIFIDGDNSFDQFPLSSPTYQGKLVLKNNALLDKAMYTIKFGKEGQWNDFGGLVEAEDATIKCVRRAVEFMSYPHTNHSYFKRCTFEYVGGINEIPLPLVTAWDNNGVVFAGCTFADYSGINEYSETNASGIFSIDASYSVVSDCNFPPSIPPVMPCPWEYKTRSSFINLNQGIYATGTGGLQTITVDETDFIDNSIACRIEGLDNVRFTRNTTLAGGLAKQGYQSQYQNQYGYYSEQSSGFEIEQNTFESHYPLIVEPVVGVYIRNSGTDANEVYNNTFKYNEIGQRFYGLNKSTVSSFQGLQFLCNDNPSSNVEDVRIEMRFLPTLNIDGIRNYQGSSNPDESAANLFSSNAQWHIRNTSNNHITYYYNGPSEQPIHYTSGLVTPSSVNTSNQCSNKYWETNPPIVIPSPEFQGIIDEYYADLDEYNQFLYTYHQNIDGGNTDSLLDAIDLVFPQDAQQLRDDLIAQSPYLSQQVIMDAAATGILTDAFLLEVCLANPDATTDEAFLNFLEYEIPNPLPPSMIQLIYQTWGGETPRTLLENQLASLNAKLGRTSSKLLHLYVTDTLGHQDSIVSLLESRNTLRSKYQLVELNMQNEDYEDALTKLAAIENNNDLNSNQQINHNNLETFINFKSTIASAGVSYLQLNEGQLSSLRSIAEVTSGRAAVLAQNILCFGYGECSTPGSEPEGRRKARRVYDLTKPTLKQASGIQANLIPNPVEENARLLLSGVDDFTSLTIDISSNDGQKVFEQKIVSPETILKLSSLPPGIYFFQLKDNSERKASGKFIKK
jgi:hypothetical protein